MYCLSVNQPCPRTLSVTHVLYALSVCLSACLYIYLSLGLNIRAVCLSCLLCFSFLSCKSISTIFSIICPPILPCPICLGVCNILTCLSFLPVLSASLFRKSTRLYYLSVLSACHFRKSTRLYHLTILSACLFRRPNDCVICQSCLLVCLFRRSIRLCCLSSVFSSVCLHVCLSVLSPSVCLSIYAFPPKSIRHMFFLA